MAILLEEEGLYDRDAHLRDRHQRGRARSARRPASSRSTRCRSTRENYIRAGGTRSFSEYYIAKYDGALFSRVAARERRLRAAQPRHGPLVQRVQRDPLPQRADLLRPDAAEPRARAVLREPRACSASSASGTRSRCGSRRTRTATRSSTRAEKLYRKVRVTPARVRARRRRHLVGRPRRAARRCSAALPADFTLPIVDRAAPRTRTPARRARRSSCTRRRRCASCEAEDKEPIEPRRTCTRAAGLPPARRAPACFALSTDGRCSSPAVDRRALRVGARTRTRRVRRRRPHGRERRRRAGLARDRATAAASRSSRTPRRPSGRRDAARRRSRGGRRTRTSSPLGRDRAGARRLRARCGDGAHALEVAVERRGEHPARRRPAGEPRSRSRRSSSRSATSSSRAARARRRSERLLQHDFAVILLDVQMPGLDGFETAALIKSASARATSRSSSSPRSARTSSTSSAATRSARSTTSSSRSSRTMLRSKVAVFVELWEKSEQLRRQAELLREQRARRELRRESEERYRTLADAMPQIVWTADARRRDDVLQPALVRVHRARRRSDARRDALADAIVTPTTSRTRREARGRPRDRRASFEIEYRFRAARRRVPLAPRPRRADARRRRRDRLLGRHRDGHRRPQAARGRAAVPRSRRATALGELARLPRGRSRTSRELAVRAHRRLVQRSHLVDADGSLERLAVAHADPAKVAARARSCGAVPAGAPTTPTRARAPHAARPARRARSRRSCSSGRASTRLHLALLRELGLALVDRACRCSRAAATLGAITLVPRSPAGAYDEADLALAEELARRAATADRQRAPLRGGRAARAGRPRARDDRRRRRPRRPRRASSGSGTRPPRRSPGSRAARSSAAAAPTRSRAGMRASGTPGRARPGRPAVRETLPVEIGGRELWLSVSGVGFEDGTVYAFRDLTEERALEQMRRTSSRRCRTSCARRSPRSTARR